MTLQCIPQGLLSYAAGPIEMPMQRSAGGDIPCLCLVSLSAANASTETFLSGWCDYTGRD